jgi:hypothetical protein
MEKGMVIVYGLSIIAGVVLLICGVQFVVSWRQRRKEVLHRKEQGGRPEAATVYPRQGGQTGYDWRYRPEGDSGLK